MLIIMKMEIQLCQKMEVSCANYSEVVWISIGTVQQILVKNHNSEVRNTSIYMYIYWDSPANSA